MRSWRCWSAVLVFVIASAATAQITSLRVGTSGDYPPFSHERGEGVYEGFDIALAQAYAEERGLVLEWVPFRWPDLIARLRADAFDLAMSGITIRSDRSAIGRFSVPLVESGAVVLVRQPERFAALGDLDQQRVRIGVNAGGHLERVANEHFPRATRVAIPDNGAVRSALLEGTVDAVVTDTFEAPIWLAGTEGLGQLGPFTRDHKAALVRADRPKLAADLDAWLLARQRDGSLARLRARYLGAGAGSEVTTALTALLAAVDERLSLMPVVGVVKRRAGLPLEVSEREQIVIDSALAATREAAARRRVEPPPDAAVRRFFRAQMEAAKEVQWKAVRDEDYVAPEPLPDLRAVLRPALLRIGTRASELLVDLPGNLEREAVRAAAYRALQNRYVSATSTRAIADAIAALSRAVANPDQ